MCDSGEMASILGPYPGLWGLALALFLFLGGAALAQGPGLEAGRIAFHTGSGSLYSIAVVEVGGGGVGPVHRITPAGPRVGNTSFGPLGRRLAFQRDGDIWIMAGDGSGARRLTHSSAYDECPSMAGPGPLIAFDRLTEGRADIYLMEADGSHLRRLTHGPGNNSCPALGPRGRRIAFVSDRTGDMEIWIMDLDGTHQRRLTHNPAVDMDPAFAPDGQHLAFASNRNGRFEIFIMDLKGGETRQLTTSRSFDVQPTFSPSGSWVAFERRGDIYGVPVKGGEPVAITHSPVYEGGPTWGLR